MASAPLCNIPAPSPTGVPKASVGLQQIPAGATLAQVIQIMNNNFNKLAPPKFWTTNGAAGSAGVAGARGPAGKAPEQKKETWTLAPSGQPTTKVRIYQVLADGTVVKENFVDVVRPTHTSMTNTVTGEILTIPGVPNDPNTG